MVGHCPLEASILVRVQVPQLFMETKHSFTHRAYKRFNSFVRGVRYFLSPTDRGKSNLQNNIKVAFIHNEKRILTGAHYINQIMATALSDRGVSVKSFYPRWQLFDPPIHMRGFANILFFHSLLEHKKNILRYHIIQGTTYTLLPFLSFNTPLVSHFGSTTAGFLNNTPNTGDLSTEEKKIWYELRNLDIISSLDLETFRPLRDIADMEKLVAKRVTKCIATSENVRRELIAMGVLPERIKVVHNAIEDYWFKEKESLLPQASLAHIVFLGRLGGDVFTLKLKGLDRLIGLYRLFPDIPKTTICMTTNRKLKEWLRVAFPIHYMYTNMQKNHISGILSKLYGSILFIPSRYEGFSLSLVEGMSQGLIPISYSVGIVPEIIRNGENGFIVSSNDEAQKRIEEIIFNNEKRLSMAEAAKKTATQFSSAIIADKLLELYKDIRKSHKLNKMDRGSLDE